MSTVYSRLVLFFTSSKNKDRQPVKYHFILYLYYIIYIYDKNLGVAQGLLLQIRYTYSEPRINSKGKQLPGRHRLFADGGPLFKNLTRIVYNQKNK